MVNYYICATPYHVINSIFIKKNYYDTDTNIMLLTNNCKNAKVIINRLANESVFEECFYVDDTDLRSDESGLIKHYRLLLERFFDQTLIDNYIKLEISADRVIVFSFTMFNMLVQTRLAEKNKQLEICVGEDGIRDYIYEDFGISESAWFKAVKCMRNYLGHPLITLPDNYKRFLYRPQLRKILYGDESSLSILTSFEVKESLGLVNRIFEYSPDANIQQKYIFFDSVYNHDLMNLQKKLVYEINQQCHDFILKQHPRNTETYEGILVYQYSYIPWEVICMNCDLSNHVLIAVNSNACFSPKFMLNSEPKIIFLYKLFFQEKEYRDTEKLVTLLWKTYSNKERIMIPSTIEELKEILLRCEE